METFCTCVYARVPRHIRVIPVRRTRTRRRADAASPPGGEAGTAPARRDPGGFGGLGRAGGGAGRPGRPPPPAAHGRRHAAQHAGDAERGEGGAPGGLPGDLPADGLRLQGARRSCLARPPREPLLGAPGLREGLAGAGPAALPPGDAAAGEAEAPERLRGDAAGVGPRGGLRGTGRARMADLRINIVDYARV